MSALFGNGFQMGGIGTMTGPELMTGISPGAIGAGPFYRYICLVKFRND